MKIEKKEIDKEVIQFTIIDCSDEYIENLIEWIETSINFENYSINHFTHNMGANVAQSTTSPSYVNIVVLCFYNLRDAVAFQMTFYD